MSARRFLSFQGSDVAPIARRGDKAVVVYLDRFGRPTTHTAEAWPHELRGHGWGIAVIKQLLELLPDLAPSAARPEPVPSPPSDGTVAAGVPSPHEGRPHARAGGLLLAHHALPKED